jgi:hypothetical protein
MANVLFNLEAVSFIVECIIMESGMASADYIHQTVHAFSTAISRIGNGTAKEPLKIANLAIFGLVNGSKTL